jgi:hypothetical protein
VSQERTAGRALGLIGLALLGLTLVLWIVFGLIATGSEPDARIVIEVPLIAAAVAGSAGAVASARGGSPRALVLSLAVLAASLLVLLFIWLLTSSVEIGG